MFPVVGYASPEFRMVFAGHERPFRPAPARDDLLDAARAGLFRITGRPGAYQAFQLIVEAKRDATIERISCEGLEPGDEFTCLSTEGVDSAGNEFLQPLRIIGGQPWPVWCLIRLCSAGERTLKLKALIGGVEYAAPLAACARGDYDGDAGTTDKDLLARLSWLNSRRGVSDRIPAPFTPIARSGRRLSVLGRDIALGPDGLPEQITTHFTGNNSTLTEEGRSILNAPVALEIRKASRRLNLVPDRLSFVSVRPHEVSWTACSAGDGVRMRVEGRLEFDGTLTINAYLSARTEDEYEVSFKHEPAEAYSRLFIGLGVNGGKTPASHRWRWDAEKRQDAYWIGNVNGGLVVRPRDPDMQQPFVNLYYHHGPRNLPVNWVNEGKGGFELENGACRFTSGPIRLGNAEKLFGVEIMISPFRPVDQEKHFNTHYYHGGPYKEDRWVEHAAANGCNVINYHHGNDGYPFINYPMYDDTVFRKLIAEAHAKGIAVKPYYTVRELTSRLPEFWAFRSLKQEIFPKPLYRFDGIDFQGETDPFIKENLDGEVIPAWKHVFSDGPYAGTTDPALITNPMSRLANFYVEGLDYMCRMWGIDGIYIDDVGYDRTVMRRVRRVLDERRPGALIDLHTWNHFEDTMGAGWGHNALLYAQLMPYLDSLWIGEGFDYDTTSAEYILIEISGLPFGLMGEMLQGGGNAWRGMLCGMTCRFPYQKDKSPLPIWKLRREFGFDDVRMIGFWDDQLPVSSGRDDVKCTVYQSADGQNMLICFASFADEMVRFSPVGLPEGWKVFLPEVEGMQERAAYAGEEICLEPAGGVILWARKN